MTKTSCYLWPSIKNNTKMKRIIPLLLIIAVIACQPVKKKTTTLNGEIQNPNKEYILVYNKDIRDTARLDSMNTFSLELEIEKPAYFTFYDGQESSVMYLSPGDELNLSLNTEEFDESINYKGTGEIPNNYLAGSYLNNEKMITNLGKELYLKNLEDFSTYLDSVKNVKLEYIENELGSNPEYTDFAEKEKSRVLFEWARLKNNYPSYHSYYAKDDEFEVGDDYYAFMDEIDVNNPKCVEVPEYKNFVNSYIRHFTDENYGKDSSYHELPLGYYLMEIKTIDDKITDPEAKQMIMKDLIMNVVNYEDITKADSILNVFYSRCSDTAYNNEVKEKVEAWKKIGEGQASPTWTYADAEGNMVSLEDFKGKYVYIDVWATWCGPCKREIPYFKKLVEEFKDNNIVFVSISVDKEKDYDTWKKMIKEDEMNWVQLISENAWDTKITKDFMIRGIPRFILIDPEGNIVTPRAPRPSGDIAELLREQEGI